MKKRFLDRFKKDNPKIYSATTEAANKTAKSIKKDYLKTLKDRIKDNPKEEDFLVGWVEIAPYKPTEFDYFLEKSVEHGLLDEQTKVILDYYNAKEKLSTPDQKT